MNELAMKEKERIDQIISIRQRQYKKISNQYNECFNNFKIFIMESNQNKSTGSLRDIQMEDIYIFQCRSFINQEGIQDDIPKMIENLPLFAILIIIIHLFELNNFQTQTGSIIFFYSRILHYFCYLFAIPWLRTGFFLTSWLGLLIISIQIFNIN